jgi:hypothetical protein
MDNTLSFDGYTYNTETHEITFTQKVCWNCKGNNIVERGISCPRYGRKQAGKACEHCGSKSKDGHRIVGTKWVTCNTCEGTGMETCDEYSSLDFSPLIQFINIVTMQGLRSATFNESYLGIGLIGGCTDYGRYLTETGRDFEKIMAHVRKETEERNRHAQGLNFILKGTNKLIETAVLKMREDGWSLLSVDAGHSTIVTK